MAFLDETGLAELWSIIKAKDEEVIGLANTKAQIAVGSYVGTGESGSEAKNTLTFDFQPRLVFISRTASSKTENMILFRNGGIATYSPDSAGKGATYVFVMSSVSVNTISWYGTNATYQKNESGKTYNYVAIG